MTDEVKNIADDRVVEVMQQNAVTNVLIASSGQKSAAALAQIAALDDKPQPDHHVWLETFLTRAGLANNTYAALAAATKYADQALAEYRKRFPLPPGPAVG